jgi:hypothetical protein
MHYLSGSARYLTTEGEGAEDVLGLVPVVRVLHHAEGPKHPLRRLKLFEQRLR